MRKKIHFTAKCLWISHPFVLLPQTVAAKSKALNVHIAQDVFVGGCNKHFPSLKLGARMIFSQYDNAPVQRTSFIKTWFAKIAVEEIKCPALSLDLNPTEHI